MRAVRECTAWEGAEQEIFVFKKPLLTRADLQALGLFAEVLDGQTAVVRYRRANTPPGLAEDYEFRLQFTEGKLSGLIPPAPLREGLGRNRITGFFALMGGDEYSTGGGIPRAQLVAANLFPAPADSLGREVEILLRPLDSRNRPIHIRLKEQAKIPGKYSDTVISFREEPGEAR